MRQPPPYLYLAGMLLGMLSIAAAIPKALGKANRTKPPLRCGTAATISISKSASGTQLKRRLHPLTGSNTWTEYHGTTRVRKVWNGRANLLELEVDGPEGHIEALSLRLYDPDSHQWSLNFASSAGGTLSTPTVGQFKNGRGEFYDQETFNGRTILVRFVISDISPHACHFEQAFSADDGHTWEVNWIATDTRLSS